VAKAVANLPAEAAAESTESEARSLPSAPTPKVKTDAQAASSGISASVGAEPVGPAIQPMKQAYLRPRETRGQRVAWYGLAAAGHGAAAFDAYSTRLAISGNYGTEGNPLLRPFSHSNSLYAATQVSPIVMDYIGKRMMVSQSKWVRRMWWLPQAGGAGFSVFAGMHNLALVK